MISKIGFYFKESQMHSDVFQSTAPAKSCRNQNIWETRKSCCSFTSQALLTLKEESEEFLMTRIVGRHKNCLTLKENVGEDEVEEKTRKKNVERINN